jgi:hypothetical protein
VPFLTIEKLPTMNAALLMGIMKHAGSLYDNSSAFNEYLKAQHTKDAAHKGDVELKSKHTIVPHVCFSSFCLNNLLTML